MSAAGIAVRRRAAGAPARVGHVSRKTNHPKISFALPRALMDEVSAEAVRRKVPNAVILREAVEVWKMVKDDDDEDAKE